VLVTDWLNENVNPFFIRALIGDDDIPEREETTTESVMDLRN